MRSFPNISREKPSFARPVRVKDPDPHKRSSFPRRRAEVAILSIGVLEVEGALR
jgi:hypothetical protein